jgi:hypothetical protein
MCNSTCLCGHVILVVVEGEAGSFPLELQAAFECVGAETCWLGLRLVLATLPVALTSRQQPSTAATLSTPPNFGSSSMS